ncbi:hypothetical protein DBP15_09025 [Streptomyces sp. CS065A]|nr:hypothetical protein DBP15_09025 [Streptomyces sp. CS065A]
MLSSTVGPSASPDGPTRTGRRAEGRFAGIRTLLTREKTVKRAVDGVDSTVRQGFGHRAPNGPGVTDRFRPSPNPSGRSAA